jgi:beta-N-acetylhexosaminidase
MAIATGRIIVSISGTVLLDKEQQVINHQNTAGVILFARNFESSEQLLSLVASIQAACSKPDMPIFVDQEGGEIQRFSGENFTQLPSLKEIALEAGLEPNEEQLAQVAIHGQKLALSLAPYGIISLTPVVDLDMGNSIISGKSRSFSDNAEKVALLSSAYINGMKSIGHPATLKHFPGHGNTYNGSDDSHIAKPHDTRQYLEILQKDLQPFIQLHKNAEAIMPAHIIFDNIDPSRPVGFSNIWMQDILRNEIGFKGITVSDCLSMDGAGDDTYLNKAREVLQVLDIAILCNIGLDETLKVLDGLGKQGLLTTSRQDKYNDWTQFGKKTRQILNHYYNHQCCLV